MKISKSLIGVSALAAALAVSPVAFAGPCGDYSQGASNNSPGNQGMNGWQSSSTTSAGEGQSQHNCSGVTERYSRLTHEANDAINHDPELQDENVHAWVNANGVVVLRGEADSAGEALRAQRLIAQYTGLKNFDNELYYPGMYGGRGAAMGNENASNQNNGNANNESAGNESNQNAASENNRNNESDENAANQNQDNQDNGATSSSGPSMGQNQGANSSGGSNSSNNQ